MDGLMTASEEIYGKKPVINSIDWQSSYAKTIADNQALLPEAQELASSVNEFNQEEILKQLRKAIPGYDSIVGKSSQIIQQQLRGEIPEDVQRAIQRNAASRNIYGGFGMGSDAGRNLEARDLGITSMQVTDRALNSAGHFIGSLKQTSTAPQFNVANMFIDPAMRLQMDEERNLLIASNIAAPDPAKRGQFDSWMGLLGMVLGVYGGGEGYQNAYKPPSSYGGGSGGWGTMSGGASTYSSSGWGGGTWGSGGSIADVQGAGQLTSGNPGIGF